MEKEELKKYMIQHTNLLSLYRKKEKEITEKYPNIAPGMLMTLILEKTKWHRKRINNLSYKINT